MNRRTLLSLALGMVLIVGWFFLLRPTFLGGPASYIMVTGTSMEPTLRSGDLVLLRRTEAYEHGDVIAFQADGGAVIHRIVGGSPESGFLTQGDNRPVIDAWRPLPQHTLGRTWLRVPYAGTVLQHLQKPWMLGLVLGGIVAMSILGGKQAANRRGHRARRPERTRGLPALSLPTMVFGLAVLVALLFAALAAFASFSRGGPVPAAAAPEVTHRGEFDYTVRMHRSALFPSGEVAPEDAETDGPLVLYRSLVRTLDLRFAYTLTGTEALDAHGEYSASLLIAADRGWTKRVKLLPPTPFEGRSLELAIPVEFGEIFALLEKIEEETQYRPSSYTLTVVPSVTLSGELSARMDDESFEPGFSMTISGVQLNVDPERSDVEQVTLSPERTAPAAALPSETPEHGARIPSAVLRWGSIAASIGSLMVGTALSFILRRRRTPRSTCDEIRRRYRSLIVDGSMADAWDGARSVHLQKFQDLVRIADREGQLIVNQQLEDRCLYFVPLAHGASAQFWS